MDTFLDVTGIVRRAKEFLNLKNDSELATYLGVSKGTVSNWCTRNRIDFHLLLTKLKDVDLNWLLVGKGSPIHQPNFCDNDLICGEVQVIHNPKTVEAIDDRSVSLYDVAAAANLQTLLANKYQYVLGQIRIPSIPLCDGAVYVSGDSMYPILKAGDIIGFKIISDPNSVIFGEMYLIAFRKEDDDYLAVKYVNQSEKPGYIKLVSYNTHHSPMDIPFTDISTMGIVKFSIRKNMIL